MIPKGWPMLGKSLAEAAAREAFEEAGISGTVDPRPLGSFRHRKRSFFGSFDVEILVHLFAVDEELVDWPEKRERTRRWFAVKEAVALVESEELREIIGEAGTRLKDKTQQLR
jgi:8-oxo-dGTP pyrophosphatase MutT (NUDIX family)